MGLRCSLLGHDFGDVVVERDRDDRGEEIVVTERELRECRRCDAESIITENTEVRRKRPTDAEQDDTIAENSSTTQAPHPDADVPSEDATSLVEEAEESAAEREQADEDAIILDDTDSESGSDETVVTGESPDETVVTGESSGTAEGLTDAGGSGPADVTPGETDPASADIDQGSIDEEELITADEEDVPGMDDPASGPDDRDGDGNHGFGATSTSGTQTDAAETPSESKWPNNPDSVDRSTPSEGEAGVGAGRDRTDDSEFQFGDGETEPTPGDPSSGIASAGPIDTTAPPEGGLDGVLGCPACDFAIPIARSANRPGDICPECHAGYLAEER